MAIAVILCVQALPSVSAEYDPYRISPLSDDDRTYLVNFIQTKLRQEPGSDLPDGYILSIVTDRLGDIYKSFRKDFFKLVGILKESIHGDWDNFGPPENPVNDMIVANDVASFRLLMASDPSYLDLASWGARVEDQGQTPMFVAVSRNSLAWVRELMNAKKLNAEIYDKGVDIDQPVAPASTIFNDNLLSISKSAAMDKLLVEFGIKTFQNCSLNGQCNSDSVRLRLDASTDSQVIKLLQKGTSLKIIGSTFKIYKLAGHPDSRWMLVSDDTSTGWIWGEYVSLQK